MRLHVIQALISKAFADDGFKQRLDSAPEDVFSEFGLTKEERKAFLNVQGRIGLATDIGQIETDANPRIEWLGPEVP